MSSQEERTRPGDTIHREGHDSVAGGLALWIAENDRAIADRWRDEIRAGAEDLESPIAEVIGDALDLMVSLLPTGLSVRREQAEAMLREVAELYGTLGAHRGLAAGEAVEEVQLLREVLLRFIYTGPGSEGVGAFHLRDLLQLNRLIDLIVTFTSVGHTDRLFFSLIDGPGVSTPPKDELVTAFRDQIQAFREEVPGLASA